jgi:GT2 family glycosyltransferase
VRNCTAVTGACMLVPRNAWEGAGGMDEAFALDYGDVDLCLRLLGAGKRTVWTPHAVLEHRESATRGHQPADLAALAAFHARWGEALADGDPYYNPGLDPAAHFELLGAAG